MGLHKRCSVFTFPGLERIDLKSCLCWLSYTWAVGGREEGVLPETPGRMEVRGFSHRWCSVPWFLPHPLSGPRANVGQASVSASFCSSYRLWRPEGESFSFISLKSIFFLPQSIKLTASTSWAERESLNYRRTHRAWASSVAVDKPREERRGWEGLSPNNAWPSRPSACCKILWMSDAECCLRLSPQLL